MQEFKLPMEDILDKFTKSEMAMMSWSSRESVADLEKKSPKRKITTKNKTQLEELHEEFGQSDTFSERQEEQHSGLPKHFYNEEGEIDLSKVTGREAAWYLSSLGWHFFPMYKR